MNKTQKTEKAISGVWPPKKSKSGISCTDRYDDQWARSDPLTHLTQQKCKITPNGAKKIHIQYFLTSTSGSLLSQTAKIDLP
jgi:hypothetical protein